MNPYEINAYAEEQVAKGGFNAMFGKRAFVRAMTKKKNKAYSKLPTPDLTDEVLWSFEQAEALRQRTGRTRMSTFGTGPMARPGAQSQVMA